MPIYEYRCGACEVLFEEMRSMTDESMPSCQQCGSVEVRKMVSRTAFQLKGGGWYKDGYASAPPKSSAQTDSVSSDTKSKTKE